MKNLKYIAFSFLIAGSSVFTGCLDEEPLYSQNNSVIFSTESNAKQALLGCYGYMAAPNGYGQQWQELPISASGFGWTNRNSGEDPNVSLNVMTSSTQVDYAWQGMYKVIAEVNAFLDNLNKSNLSDDVKSKLGAEAHFLRGVAYYNLVAHFGDVPMRTSASSWDGIAMPRTPKEQVFGLIIDDFKAALVLPETPNDGYATGLAAKAYLGKVYHKMACLDIDKQANLTNAKAMFDEVYGKYQLQPKFADLFVDHVNGSKESIFQLNYNAESTLVFNRACNRFAPAHSNSGIAWGTYKTTKALYDWMRATYPGDPRIAVSFLTSWRQHKNNQANDVPQKGDKPCANDSTYSYPYITYKVKGVYVMKNGKPVMESGKPLQQDFVAELPYADMADPSNPSIAKFADYTKQAKEMNTGNIPLTGQALKDSTRLARIGESVKKDYAASGKEHASPYFGKMFDKKATGTRSHKNLIVYRYAEMLLLMADVYNELGNKDRAIELANEVLKRARQSVAGAKEPADWPKSLTQGQVREKLYYERIFEFVGEPNMYDMVRLKGVDFLKKALEKHNNHEITKESAKVYQETKNNKQDRLYNEVEGGALTPDFLKKNLLLPIPLSEINYNEGITVDQNNFGY